MTRWIRPSISCCRHLAKGDILIDGGNSNYKDSIRRAEKLKSHGVHFVDAGTSGGVWGLQNGYCMMIGGEKEIVDRLAPIFTTLAPRMAICTSAPTAPAIRQNDSQRHRIRHAAGVR